MLFVLPEWEELAVPEVSSAASTLPVLKQTLKASTPSPWLSSRNVLLRRIRSFSFGQNLFSCRKG
jgi:hypothetical protein